MCRLSDPQAGGGETEGGVEPHLAVAYGLVPRLESVPARTGQPGLAAGQSMTE
jgi:hypothetical protein